MAPWSCGGFKGKFPLSIAVYGELSGYSRYLCVGSSGVVYSHLPMNLSSGACSWIGELLVGRDIIVVVGIPGRQCGVYPLVVP